MARPFKTALAVFYKLIDFFQPDVSQAPAHTSEASRERRVFVGSLLSVALAATVASTASIIGGMASVPAKFDPTDLTALVPWAALLMLRWGHPVRRVSLLIAYAVIVHVFAAAVRRGTPLIPSTTWLLPVVVFVATFVGPRAGIAIAAAGLAVVLFAFGDPLKEFDAQNLDVIAHSYISVIEFSSVLVALLLFGLYGASERRKQRVLRDKYYTQMSMSTRTSAVISLVRGVNHELNNPLTILMLSIEKARAACATENRSGHERALDLISSSAERIRDIVQALSRYSGIHPIAQSESFLLSDAVKEAISVLGGLYASQGVPIEFVSDNSDSTTLTNRRSVEFILTNLLSNARDAILAKGSGKITVRVSQKENSVVLSVRDNGVGIPKEHLASVWDPFFTTKDPGKGTGMGLAVVQSLVKEMNAQIKIESEENKFTEVTLSIPA